MIKNTSKTQNKTQFENTILKNIKASYNDFLKLATKKDLIKFTNDLQTKTIVENDKVTTILLLNKSQIDFIKNYINCDFSKISNNDLKTIINNAYKNAYFNGLVKVEQTKEQINYKQLDTIKTYAFYKSINLQVYFYKKQVIKNRLTGCFETK